MSADRAPQEQTMSMRSVWLRLLAALAALACGVAALVVAILLAHGVLG
jgi:hypothetical protein